MALCPRCGYSSTRRAGLLRHLNRKQPCLAILSDEEPKKLIEALFKEDGSFTCDVCESVWTTRAQLILHMSGECAPTVAI